MSAPSYLMSDFSSIGIRMRPLKPRLTWHRYAVPSWLRFVRSGLLAVAILGSLAGCMSDKSISPNLRAPEGTLGQGVASPMNLIMAVGDTVTVGLHVTSLTGAPITSVDSTMYVLSVSSDSQYVHVSRSGLVTGMQPTMYPVKLWVLAFKDGAMSADEVILQVTSTAFTAARLSIHPTPPDSARWPVLSQKILNPVVRDTISGQTVSGVILRLEFGPQDSSSVVCFSEGFSNVGLLISSQLSKNNCAFRPGIDYNTLNALVGMRTGTIWVHANVLAYGRMLRDSLQFTFINPPTATIAFSTSNVAGGGANTPLNVAITPGGRVVFNNNYDRSFGTVIDVVFDNPAGAAGYPATSPTAPTGNIIGLKTGSPATRRFPTAGTYGYTFTITDGVTPFKGVTGRGTITVE